MSRLVACALLLAACGSPRLTDVPVCGAPCGSDVGACHRGVWLCGPDGVAGAVCYGEVGPTEEICDGIDNDCNGHTDELVPRPCSTACGSGKESCVAGEWTACTAPPVLPETCNGLDDNCDGRVDEADALPLEFCYPGPAGTLAYGECRPGVVRCVLGVSACTGYVLPTAETKNCKDDDCDGKVDEDFPIDPADVVVIFDNSASMAKYTPPIKAAFAAWGQKHPDYPYRWALITAPDMDYFTYGHNPHLYLPFTAPGDYAAFSMALGKQDGFSGTGEEPTLDAVVLAATLGWSLDNRILIVFSDEEAQSYGGAPGYGGATVTATEAVVAAHGAGLAVTVFTTGDGATYGGMGSVKAIDESAGQLEADLTVVLGGSCR